MPLPGIFLPSSVRPFLVAAHATQWGSHFEDIPMGTGHMRKRRVCSSVSKVFDVSLLLERDEMADFRRWHWDTLRSGERSFSARVKNEGAGQLWYEAQFVGMYTARALHLGRWFVSAQLLLDGDGQEAAPTLGAFSAEMGMELLGTGRLSVPKIFAVEIVIPLMASIRFSAEFEIALEPGEVGS